MEIKAKYLFQKIQNKTKQESIRFIKDELQPLYVYIQYLKEENKILKEKLDNLISQD